MDVVEFRDRRVAGLGHLDVRLRRDRLEGVGVDAIQERVHRLPPRPEAVVARRASCGPCGRRARAGTRASAGSASPARPAPRGAPVPPSRHRGVTAAMLPSSPMSSATFARPAVRQQRGGSRELQHASLVQVAAAGDHATPDHGDERDRACRQRIDVQARGHGADRSTSRASVVRLGQRNRRMSGQQAFGGSRRRIADVGVGGRDRLPTFAPDHDLAARASAPDHQVEVAHRAVHETCSRSRSPEKTTGSNGVRNSSGSPSPSSRMPVPASSTSVRSTPAKRRERTALRRRRPR